MLYNKAGSDLKYLWEQKSYDWWVDSALFETTWLKLKDITFSCINEALRCFNTSNIGLSVNFAGIKLASEVIKYIHSVGEGKKIIVGGWACQNGHMRGLFPKGLVDVFVVGEGEETLADVLQSFDGCMEKSQVRGAIFDKEPDYIYRQREPIIDLDSIPWPTFAGLDLTMYKNRGLPLFTSRGCIGNCSFCNDHSSSKPYRFRSAQSIFDEIKYHVINNHAVDFSFKDLLCNGNIEQLGRLCDLIINSGLDIKWDSQAVAREEMTYDFLRKLKKAGCNTLIYGVESFSDNVLRKMKKIFTAKTAEDVIMDTCAAGIYAYVNIIVGFPGETEDDFVQTCRALERISVSSFVRVGAISVCLINFGSELNTRYEDYGLILPDDTTIRAKEWASSDGSNTYEIRNERARRILGLVEKLGLTYATTTI
jgi:radical SAM superfamily enzyme YgiQ (UPF0313 family)